MGEVLLERMGKGDWGDGALVRDLRAHLRPLIDLDKENDDVDRAAMYASFLSKVVGHAIKSAQGADAYHALDAGSVAITCLAKIRCNLKAKPLDYERSVHNFIGKAVAAKKYELAEKHCDALIGILARSPSLPGAKKAMASSQIFLPQGKDADLAQLVICTLLHRITSRLGLQKIQEEQLDAEVAQSVQPWIAHWQSLAPDAPLANDSLFRFYNGLAKAPEQINDNEAFVHLINVRTKAFEYYSYKLLGTDGNVFIDLYLYVAAKLECCAVKDTERWRALLRLHVSTIEAAEARRKGQWLTETPLCAKWMSIIHHAATAALKSADSKRVSAYIRHAEGLMDKNVRNFQPALAALYSARFACIESDQVFDNMAKEMVASLGRVATRICDSALVTLDFKASTATEDLVRLAFLLCKDLDGIRRAIKNALSTTGKLRASSLWKNDVSRGQFAQAAISIFRGFHSLVMRGCTSAAGDFKSKFAQFRAYALDGLDHAAGLQAEADSSKLHTCKEILLLLDKTATGAEAGSVARAYYNVGARFYTDGNAEAAVEFFEKACEQTERGASVGDQECVEKLQRRFAALADARSRCGNSNSMASLYDLGHAVQVSFKGNAPPTESIDRFVRFVIKTTRADPALVANEEFLRSAVISTHFTAAKPVLTPAQVGAILMEQLRVLQSLQALAPECSAAVLKLLLAKLKELYADKPLNKGRVMIEEAKKARLDGERDAAQVILAEAEKVLKKEAGTDEARAELAVLSAWRVAILHEAKAEDVSAAEEKAEALDAAEARWRAILDRLPDSAIPTLRAALRSLVEFLALQDLSVPLLSFARIAVTFTTKAAATAADLCSAHIRVAEAGNACGLAKTASVSVTAALKDLTAVKPSTERCLLLFRLCTILAALGRKSEAIARFAEAHSWLSSQSSPSVELQAAWASSNAQLLAEGLNTSTGKEVEDMLGEAVAYALGALRARRRVLAVRSSGEEGTAFADLLMPEARDPCQCGDFYFCDWENLRFYLQELHLAGTLYCAVGGAREAEWYFNRGLALAEKIAAQRWQIKFILGLADVEYHLQHYKPALELLAKADKKLMVSKGDNGDDEEPAKEGADEKEIDQDSLDVLIELRTGDIRRRKGELKEARENYENAQLFYECLVDSGTARHGEAVSYPLVSARIERKMAELAFAVGSDEKAEQILQPLANCSLPLESLHARLMLCRILLRRAYNVDQLACKWDPTLSSVSTQPLTLSSSASKKKAAARSTAAAAATAATVQPTRNLIESILSDALNLLDKARLYSSPPLLSTLCGLIAECSGVVRADYRGAKALQEGMAVTLRHLICCIAVKHRPGVSPALSLSSSSAIATASASSTETQLCAAMDQLSFNNNYADPLRLYGFASCSAEFREAAVQQLPKQWTVCTLRVTDDLAHLLVCRISSRQPPLVLRLPLCTAECDSFKVVHAEFAEVMKKSSETLETAAATKQPEWWWTMRRELNERLKVMCNDIEEQWLAHWKGVLLGVLAEESDVEALQSAVEKVTEVIGKHAKIPIDSQLLEICVDSMAQLSPDQLQACLLRLLGWPTSALPAKDLTQLKKIQAAVREAGSELDDSPRREAVTLVLDKHTQALPWECIPILFDSPVCRSPSLHFVVARAVQLSRRAAPNAVRDGVDPRKTFYVLNPSGDLLKSQKLLEPQFKAHNWIGVAGKEPVQEWLNSHMEQDDLFVYSGHNAGESFLNPDSVQLLSRCPVALLFGCSSGRLADNGDYEPSGSILAYLQAGSAAALGNLWHVTDGDIDRFTEALLKGWLRVEGEGKSLPELMPVARRTCKLPYLVGAAPVCYGVPVFIRGAAALEQLAKE